jgi:hypothetical protein
MARANREMRRLQASVRSLQTDLGAVVDDLEQIASSGKDVGLEQARAQLDHIKAKLGGLFAGSLHEPAEALQRSIGQHPVASVATAFAAGLAASLLMFHGSNGARRY